MDFQAAWRSQHHAACRQVKTLGNENVFLSSEFLCKYNFIPFDHRYGSAALA
ncbi:hypothetical protein [Paraburkholderia metrosideri]|jgi:hypothetical protein|uniref:hypothetical protein n=1 Tax=Paraburkholderia metrosideri TaxID=580937 RepID=UPI00191864A7|nr:hypothetical protein [Paraburkholderia metrosideri]